MPTAQRLVERSLSRHGDRVSVVDAERTLTYRDLRERSARLANALLGFGAGPERPAAALLPNRAEYVEFDVACTRAGITRVGLSDRLSADECRYILDHSRAATLITTAAHLERLGELPDDLGAVLLVDEDGGGGHGHASLAGYEPALAAANAQLDVVPVAPDAPAYILYTSGTTGRPKGAAHTHAGRRAAIVNMLASELSLERDSVMVHAGPLTHGSGSKLLAFLAAGGANVLHEGFDPDAFAAAVRDRGGTHTFLVPTMIQRLLEAGPEVAEAARSLRLMSFGGSPIAPRMFERAIEAFGPVLCQVYGSCEAPHPVTLLGPGDYADDMSERVLRSAGWAAAGAELRVVDDSGTDVTLGEAGELLINGRNLMSGYWRDEAATREAFTEEGWYASGDVVRMDEDGLVTFEDRKRDLIITGGLNVYPSEVERVLAEHPAVREVAVLGYPDDAWGESVMAYVVPAEGTEVTEEELIGWAREQLASYKKPRRVEFLERMPLGSSNKVLRKELREALWQDRDRGVN
ncbi:MAG TPA: AMP-binding protein [Thermoleophilaceae bacterium]|nr:AMP-binding protein [Thermoleophilaceae bacterium]